MAEIEVYGESEPLLDHAMRRHNETVSHVAEVVKGFHASHVPFRIYHGGPKIRPGMRQQPTIDISSLTNVLSVNPTARTIIVEPAVTMQELLTASLPYGLMPPVIIEFPGVTAGAAFAGMGAESGSFRYGAFEDTVGAIEIVLGTGDIVSRATPENEYADLFGGAAAGCGTLGVVTMLEIRLLEAKPFVELTYHVLPSIKEAVRRIEAEIATARETGLRTDGLDFLDGIAYSPTSAVVMTGRLTPAPAGMPIRRFTRRTDPFFFAHVANIVAAAADSTTGAQVSVTEVIPLADYLFRFDRGMFFGGGTEMSRWMPTDSASFRWLVSPALNSRSAIRVSNRSGMARLVTAFVASIPPASAAQFTQIAGDEFGLWPVWLLPFRVSADMLARPGQHFNMGRTVVLASGQDTLVGVGYYGLGKLRTVRELSSVNREVTLKVQQLGGMVCTPTGTFLNEDEFWKLYDWEWYHKLRRKYGAERLPPIFDKLKMEIDTKGMERPFWLTCLLAVFRFVCLRGR